MTNERGHYHLDLIPRYAEDPPLEALALALREPPAGVLRRSQDELLARLSERLAANSLIAVERL